MSMETIKVTPPLESEPFKPKQIVVRFDIATPAGGWESLTLDRGHRVSLVVSNAGMGFGAQADIDIWGMDRRDMNKLSYVAGYPNVDVPQFVDESNSFITITAGSVGFPNCVVFKGAIRESFMSLKDNGNPFFHVTAASYPPLNRNILPPMSYKGAVSVQNILSDICAQEGIQMVDHGGWDRNSFVKNHVSEGTALDRIKSVMKAVRGTYHISESSLGGSQGEAGVFTTGIPYQAVLDVYGPSYSGKMDDIHTVPVLAKSSGLIGYPEYSPNGLVFRCLFRNDISFYQPIYLKDEYTPAGWRTNSAGVNQQRQRIPKYYRSYWLPIQITHRLAAEIPHGPWETIVECQPAFTMNTKNYATPTAQGAGRG